MRPALLGAAMMLAFASAAHATSVGRTFVSGGGSDANVANNCTVVNPCRSFSAAYGITSAGGEIVALDAAGYGGLTINWAISIIAPSGASLGAAASSTAITINAGAGNIVILDGLVINGNNLSNTIGIQVNSGRLFLLRSTLKNLTTGLSVGTANADAINDNFVGNTTAMTANGTGNSSSSNPTTTSPTAIRLDGGNVLGNGTAFNMVNPGSSNVSIWLRINSNTSAAITTNIAGNATVTGGSGTGCPCTAVGVYSGGQNFNFP